MSALTERLKKCLNKKFLFTFGFLLTIFLKQHGAYAATFDINSADSSGLISAIDQANTNGEPDIINLSSESLYELTTVNNSTHSANGLPLIISEITINGNLSTISRNSVEKFRILAIEAPGKLILNNITLKNGLSENYLNGGGAILNYNGILEIKDSDIYQNIAGDGGGGGLWLGNDSYSKISHSSFDNNSATLDGSGGAISKRGAGDLEIFESFFTNNFAQNNGGALYSSSNGIINIVDSNFLNNSSKNHGGAIHNYAGSIIIKNSTLSNNKTTSTNINFGFGGGIFNDSVGTITITGSELSNNTAPKTGGFLYSKGKAIINYSCITDNSSTSVYNFSLNQIDAKQNFWGSVDGPSGAGSGSGDSISSNVSFIPFLTFCSYEIPAVKTPVVLLPGLGASWDTTAMLTGGAGDDWNLTPFVKVYDNFRNTLINNAGYVKNQDYFEFYYDWRQPLAELTDDLDNFLTNTVLAGKPTGTKANLVGHSMGGLLATAYSHQYGLDKVNKIITVGSPHAGAIPAWSVWSGGEMIDRWSWGWLALEIYLQLQKGSSSSPVDVARNLAPSINDLLPIFDFAKRENGEIIPITTMSSTNPYLIDLKANLSVGLKNILSTFAGKEDNADNDTIRWVKLGGRSIADKLLGKWEDGKPVSFEYTADGDLTVLQKSALVAGATASGIINTAHTTLLENQAGIQMVLDALGLTGVTPATDVVSPPRNPTLVFLFNAPDQLAAEMTVDTPNPTAESFFSKNDKLLIVPNAEDGKYNIKVIGKTTGDYTVEVGQLTDDENVWTPLEGEIKPGETDVIKINFNSANPDEQPIIDATGKTQINMAALVFDQIETQVRALILPTIYKTPVLDYLNELDNLTTKALNQIKAGNYEQAASYTKSVMAGAYNLRQKIDAIPTDPGLTNAMRADLKNQANQAGNLMIDAYANVFTKSGQTLNLDDVNEHIKISRERNKAAADQLATVSGENVFAGEAYQLSLQFLTQAVEDKKAGKLPAAWAKSVVSRLLSLEATKLID